MKDRSMQALQLLGSEPVAETLTDTVSFGGGNTEMSKDALDFLGWNFRK